MKHVAAFLCLPLLVAPLLRAQQSYGTIRAKVKIDHDGSEITTITDPEKHTSEEIVRDAGKKLVKKTVYELDERDIATAATFYDAKGLVTHKATYQRDEAGRVVQADFTGPDGRYLGKRTYVYGANNVPTQVINYDANGQMLAAAEATAEKPKKRR